MTRTIDVTGLPVIAIRRLEEIVQLHKRLELLESIPLDGPVETPEDWIARLRASIDQHGFEGVPVDGGVTREHHPLYIKNSTPEERIARLKALVAEFADNTAVIEDDTRRALYADQPKC